MSKLTIGKMREMKAQGKKIVMCTAYDVPTAKMAAAAGVDVLLVGDSLGQVVLGYDSTVPVTVEEMIHHGKAAVRGGGGRFVVLDMPYGSYHISDEDTLRNGLRMVKETGADALKLEGLRELAPRVRSLRRAGIPVVAHIGLTPQTTTMLGGYRVQGRNRLEAVGLIEAAHALEEAGAFMLVLECVAAEVAATISAQTEIPTIGIGSGVGCDGQVLVFYDLLGLNQGFQPSFLKQFADLWSGAISGLEAFGQAVRSGDFPDAAHSFPLSAEEREAMGPLLVTGR